MDPGTSAISLVHHITKIKVPSMSIFRKKALGVVLGLLFASGAQAGSYVIDDFNSNDQAASDLVVDGNPVNATPVVASRTLSQNLTATIPPATATAQVGFGFLDITNGLGEVSTVRVGWTLPAGTVPVGATNVVMRLRIVSSDGNPTSLDFRLNGASIKTDSVPGNTNNQDVDVAFTAAQLNPGGPLELVIEGSAGWDMTVDSIGLMWTDPVPPGNVAGIPTLSEWGLLLLSSALGVVAWSLQRRRK